MAGRWELGLQRSGGCSLKEQLARTTLNSVRSQGHPYIELREDGKRFIFFCTLCLSPCYSDSVLFDHLKGNLHTERLSAAKVTLLKQNPWPFSDGVHFFDNFSENEKTLGTKKHDSEKLLESSERAANLAIVNYDETLKPDRNVNSDCGDALNGSGTVCDIVIPNVLIQNEISDLQVRFFGSGRIAARFCEKEDSSREITRLWCEWLGKSDLHDEILEKVVHHDFAVITFPYNYDLGRKGLLEDVKLLLPSSSAVDLKNGEANGRKRKKSFSDPGDASESFGNQFDSEEESSASNGSSSRLLLTQYDDQVLNSPFITSKTLRRELRRQQRIAAERMCDICQQKMLPDKDVATLMNSKTGKLACSSRNTNGAFHVFHTSCLIHWILLCEDEMLRNQSVGTKARRRPRKKTGGKSTKEIKDRNAIVLKSQIESVFCPECQGTGVNTEGDQLEMPAFPLSEMFKYKIKVSDGRRAWMKSPEVLPNCSTGFHFPSQSKEVVKEEVKVLKLLQFYRA